MTEESQDAKNSFFNCANLILILWGKCMLIAFKIQQSLFCVFTNYQTYWQYIGQKDGEDFSEYKLTLAGRS